MPIKLPPHRFRFARTRDLQKKFLEEQYAHLTRNLRNLRFFAGYIKNEMIEEGFIKC